MIFILVTCNDIIVFIVFVFLNVITVNGPNKRIFARLFFIFNLKRSKVWKTKKDLRFQKSSKVYQKMYVMKNCFAKCQVFALKLRYATYEKWNSYHSEILHAILLSTMCLCFY